MSDQYVSLAEPAVQVGRRCGGNKCALLSLFMGVGLLILFSQAPCTPWDGQRLAAEDPPLRMFWQGLIPMMPPRDESESQSSNFLARRDPFKELSKESDLPGASTGQYTTRSFASISHSGPDGKVATERFASSAAGHGKNGIHEARYLYSNSSGTEKSSYEQHLGGRSRMAVTEKQSGNQSQYSQLFRGMNEAGAKAFDQDFETSAEHLPHRVELGQDSLEPPSKDDIHDWALPFDRADLGHQVSEPAKSGRHSSSLPGKPGRRRKLADMFSHHDLWDWTYHNSALPFAHEEEEEDGDDFWGTPVIKYHALPFTTVTHVLR